MLNYKYYLAIVYYVFAAITFFINPLEGLTKRIGLWLGSISYGVYIVHFPILLLFGRVSTFSGNLFFYSFRIILYISVTLFSAWVLEKKIQPIFKSILK